MFDLFLIVAIIVAPIVAGAYYFGYMAGRKVARSQLTAAITNSNHDDEGEVRFVRRAGGNG